MREHVEPTAEEARAIASLKRLARKWPRSLWLFSASGTLCVMRRGEDGEHAITDQEGIDSAYLIDVIQGIDNDGGDW
jgi:hypothetical protein